MAALYVLSGTQAAGKSTVGHLLAEQLPRSVFIDGDTIGAMVVTGWADMSPEPSTEAMRQLLLRYQGMLTVAETYLCAGFDAVTADVIIGPVLNDFLALVTWPQTYLVFLDPDLEEIRAREAGRAKTGYGTVWDFDGLHQTLRRQTPRQGLWLDTSQQSPQETTDTILARRREGLIHATGLH